MKSLAFFLLTVALANAQVPVPAPAPILQSEVLYAIDTNAITPARVVNQNIVRRMVNSLICGLTARPTPREAWRTLVSPKDTVGIKVSAGGRAVSGTNPEVVLAVAEGLIAAGVPPTQIVVWDRNIEDLTAAGYDTSGEFYQLEGIDPKSGYDPKAQVSAPVIGKLIWGDSKFGDRKVSRFSDMLTSGDQLSSTSFFATVLSSRVTKVVNIPSLTDSFLTGVHGALVNMTLPNLDNWRRFAKSTMDGSSYIAELYADPTIHDKVVVTLLDGLVLQYAGGPFPDPNFAVDNFTIFASKDPVAIDSTAVRLIDELRKDSKLPSVRSMTSYIDAANQIGLGEYAEPRIHLTRVGLEGIR